MSSAAPALLGCHSPCRRLLQGPDCGRVGREGDGRRVRCTASRRRACRHRGGWMTPLRRGKADRVELFGCMVDPLDAGETLDRCEALLETDRFTQHVALNV